MRVRAEGHDGELRKDVERESGRTAVEKGQPVERVSRKEGLKFCRLLIQASAAITPIIDKSDDHIGSVADIGLLSPQGFTWLCRDKPIPK